MHLMGCGTMVRLVSVVDSLLSLSKSQQQFVTAKKRTQPRGFNRNLDPGESTRFRFFQFASNGFLSGWNKNKQNASGC